METLRLPVNTDREERMAAAAADSGGKNCIRQGQRSGYARMERRTLRLRTETEDAKEANVRMMKSHDMMTVLGSDT